MSRTRVGVGIAAVAAGMAWALGGNGFLATSGRRLAELLPLLLVLGGVSAILLVVVPRGALAGPGVLISMGLLGLTVEHGMLHKSLLVHVPAFILISLGIIIAMSRRKSIKIDTGVKRFTTIFFPARRRFSSEAPIKIVVRAIFGLLELDMSEAGPSRRSARVWADVTCLVGRIELILPKEWEVQAGRVELARHITFEGKLTRTEFASSTEQEDDPCKNLVVINVLGWGGVVRVRQI